MENAKLPDKCASTTHLLGFCRISCLSSRKRAFRSAWCFSGLLCFERTQRGLTQNFLTTTVLQFIFTFCHKVNMFFMCNTCTKNKVD